MNRFRDVAVLAVAMTGFSNMYAHAVPISAVSYDMLNGNGVASSGNFNYWDLNYSGAGATTVDNAALSGGLGDLTDGVIASDNWINVENLAGTGPYVGWRHVVAPDPKVTFRFAGPIDLDSISQFTWTTRTAWVA